MANPPSLPRVGKFPQTTQILWSDNTPFTGIAYVGLIYPTYPSTNPTGDALSVDWGNFYPEQKVPSRIPIPIINGYFNNNLGLFYNADLTPPNSLYQLELFDTTGRSVSASPTSSFPVNSDPIALPSIAAPTAPTTGSTFPTPG